MSPATHPDEEVPLKEGQQPLHKKVIQPNSTASWLLLAQQAVEVG
jgi:hypothetical protein